MTPVTWNTNAINAFRYRIHGKWVNYLSSTGWENLNAEFRLDSGRYLCDKAPGVLSVPLYATGSTIWSVDQRWNIFNKSDITDPSLVMESTPQDVSAVAGVLTDEQPDRIVYPNAFANGIDLQYRLIHGRGFRTSKEIVIRSNPPGDQDLTFSWNVACSNARLYLNNAGSVSRPWSGNVSERVDLKDKSLIIRHGTSLDNESLIRGSGVKIPKAWYFLPDGTEVSIPIDVNIIIIDPSVVRFTKIIPRSFIDAAFQVGATAVYADDVTTVYPDANVESTSVDGDVTHALASNWTTLRSAAGNSSNDRLTTMYIDVVCNDVTDEFYNMDRIIAGFDLSSIDGHTASSVELGMTYNQKDKSISGTIGAAVVGATPASNTALANADYTQLGGTRYCDTDVDSTNWSAGVLTWAFNSAGLSAVNSAIGGVFNLGLRLSLDVDDVEPTWATGYKSAKLGVRSADLSGTGSDPYLEVTSEVVASSDYIPSSCSGSGPSYTVTYTSAIPKWLQINGLVYVEHREAGNESNILSTYTYRITALTSSTQLTLMYVDDTDGLGDDSPCSLCDGTGSYGACGGNAPHIFRNNPGSEFMMFL
jgi:hypothetical protein